MPLSYKHPSLYQQTQINQKMVNLQYFGKKHIVLSVKNPVRATIQYISLHILQIYGQQVQQIQYIGQLYINNNYTQYYNKGKLAQKQMIADYPLIPSQAFLYFPDTSHIIQTRNNKPQRILFSGSLSEQYTPAQKSQLQQLKQYLKQQSEQQLASYPDDLLLRFLQASNFDFRECCSQLGFYAQWEARMLPLVYDQRIGSFLKKGIIYMCGRDYHFRPIVVINIGKIIDMDMNQQQLLDCLGYFFQYVIENCLVQGQVQTWVSVIDLNYASPFSLGSTLLEIIKYLSRIFKARSHQTYLLKCASSIKFGWNMVKKVLNQDQLRKISLSDRERLKQQDFLRINRNQIQQKYGGLHPNIINFWPIQIQPYHYNPSPNTSLNKNQKQALNVCEQVALITEQEYNRLYKEGKLRERKIKKSLINEFSQVGNNLGRFMSKRSMSLNYNLSQVGAVSMGNIQYGGNLPKVLQQDTPTQHNHQPSMLIPQLQPQAPKHSLLHPHPEPQLHSQPQSLSATSTLTKSPNTATTMEPILIGINQLEFIYPEEKRPMLPFVCERVFSYMDLFY